VKTNCPILVIMYNRPEIVTRLWRSLRGVRPEKLYVACDGARSGKKADLESVERTRATIREIDWNCQVETLFHQSNLGCKFGPYKSMDWFFALEERGIILEDDCIPHPSFFRYCEELLDKYEGDERIMTICGDRSPLGDAPIPGGYSYAFSKYPLTWGWGTWRRAWNMMDIDGKSWPDVVSTGVMRSVFRNEDEYYWFWGLFERTYRQQTTDSWDEMWLYNCLFHHGLSILPETNLISNIGFGDKATHTGDPRDPRSALPALEMSFPMRHPRLVASPFSIDKLVERRGFGIRARPAWRRLAKRVKLVANRLRGKDLGEYAFRESH
jgi:hypothetical protein